MKMIKARQIASAVTLAMLTGPALATGHFEHKGGKVGDWFWKDVDGYYTANTNGRVPAKEGFTVFCSDPDSRGGVAFSISVQGSQVGNKKLSLRFNDGETIDVIANYSRVSAESAVGQRIIAQVVSKLRSGREVRVKMQGAPEAVFSLKGSGAALKNC